MFLLSLRVIHTNLCASYIIGVPTPYVLPTLCFNFATWKFRLPSLAARNHRNGTWMANRISDIARDLYTTSTKKKPRHKHTTMGEDPSVNKHAKIVELASIRTAICYTDGSATPNPGPSGAGASIFLRNPDRVHDLGVSTGSGTNNIGELVALHICFMHLTSLFERGLFDQALIFSDSRYALGLASSSKPPASNHQVSQRC